MSRIGSRRTLPPALTEADLDTAFHGLLEDRRLEIKCAPPKTERLVQHIQGGTNGVEDVLTIIIGADEVSGRYDQGRKTPLTNRSTTVTKASIISADPPVGR